MQLSMSILRIATPLVLLVGVWMIMDGHRTAAIILMLVALAEQLVLITLEHHERAQIEHERLLRASVKEHERVHS